jgi:hypothetical protein
VIKGVSSRHLVELLPSTTVAVGQATETDTAQHIGRPQRISVGQATETDTAQQVLRFSLSPWTWSKAIRVSSLNYNTLTRQIAIDLSTISAIFAAAKADGSDIRVTDVSRASFLSHYLESYNAVGHTGTLWVKLTGLTTAGATIYIFAGNPAATSISTFSSTFQKLQGDSKTKLLWHFDEGSGTTAADASANSLNGTITGATWVGSDGGGWNGTTTTFSTGDSLSFAASNKVANTSVTLPTGGTLEFWLRPDFAATTAVHKQIALFGDASSYAYFYFNQTTDDFRLDNASGNIVNSTTQTFSANTWLHVALVWYDNPTNVRRIYVNGTDVTESNVTSIALAANAGFSFAYSAVRAEAGFTGRADEVRFSSYPRTAEEIQASYQRRAPLPANTVLTKNGSNPTVPTGVTWEGNNTDEPAVIYESGTYKMWYRGGEPFSGPHWAGIGYATSADGETWTKYASNPVITGASGSAYWTPYVFKDGSTYYLYATKQLSSTPGSGSTIVRFTSSDGISWSAATEVLTLSGSEQNFGNKTVWIEGSTWYMLYEWQNVSFNWLLSLATSSDGVTWTKSGSNPVLQIASGAGTVGGPEVRKIGSYYYLLAQTAPSGNTPTDIYLYRSSNLTSWTELGTNPVLWRSKTWETNQVADASLVDDPSGTTSHFYFDGVNGSVEQTGSASTPFTVNQLLTAAEAPTYSASSITVTIGQATETDTAQTLSHPLTVAVAQATETDMAQAAIPLNSPVIVTRASVAISDSSVYTVILSDSSAYILTVTDSAL